MPTQSDPDHQFLFAATRYNPDPAWLTGQVQTRTVNLERVINLAHSYNITSLLYWQLKSPEIWPHIPAPVQQQIKTTFSAGLGLVMAYLDELSRLSQAFTDAGIKFIVLKGAAWGKLIYPHPGMRPFQDIDLLLRPEQLGAADEILSRNYCCESLPDVPLRRNCHFHLNYIRQGSAALRFELHWALFPPDTMLKLDLERFWQQAQPLPNYPGALAPSPEHLLLHACLHFTGHGFLSLRDLWDVAWMVDSHHLNWDEILNTADSAGMGNRLFWTLYFSHRLLNTAIPDEVIHHLQPPRFVCRIFLSSFSTTDLLAGAANSQKDLQALLFFFLHQGNRRLQYLARLPYPGICWVSLFPDESMGAVKTLLVTLLRGIRLIGFICYKLLRGTVRGYPAQSQCSIP